jgi:hypothetical protein
MPYPAGKLPFHRRADPKAQAEAVRHRYRRTREVGGPQIATLQRAPDFLSVARLWYDRGYRDWHVVAAVTNSMINDVLEERKIDLSRPKRPPLRHNEMLESIRDRIFPAARFTGERIDEMMFGFELAALAGLGFVIRDPALGREQVRRFLRERMNFYEFDLPHPALFADPPGDWPKLEA